MKKILFILTMQILTNASTVGQEKKSGNVKEELVQCIEEMGKDTFSLLNDCESKYMNYNFQEKKGLFDFKGKKIAFFKGSSGTVKWTKKEYFIVRKETINHMGYVPSFQMVQCPGECTRILDDHRTGLIGKIFTVPRYPELDQ